MAMLFQDVHKELIRNHIEEPNNEDEMLLWMMLLHTHKIELSDSVVLDDSRSRVMHGATQRSAARVVSDLWADRADPERTLYVYWYEKYIHAYSGTGSVPAEKADAIEILRKRVESDPRVKSVSLDEN